MVFHEHKGKQAEMDNKKTQVVAYALIGVFFVVGVACYAAFPVKAPTEPVRVLYQPTAGKVVFSHKVHAGLEDTECSVCHHHPEDGETTTGCGKCHEKEKTAGKPPAACLAEGCHEPEDVEDADYPARMDSYHQQCIGCHVEQGKGPGEGPENCKKCHML